MYKRLIYLAAYLWDIHEWLMWFLFCDFTSIGWKILNCTIIVMWLYADTWSESVSKCKTLTATSYKLRVIESPGLNDFPKAYLWSTMTDRAEVLAWDKALLKVKRCVLCACYTKAWCVCPCWACREVTLWTRMDEDKSEWSGTYGGGIIDI